MNRQLIEHIETHVGPLQGYWDKDANGSDLPAPMGQFLAADGIVVTSTLGLSDHELLTPKGIARRTEIVWIGRDNQLDAKSVVADVAGEAVKNHWAPTRGEVIGPREPFLGGSSLTAVYIAIPVVISDDFAVLDSAKGRVLFPWLLPISGDEAAFARREGFRAFEDAVDEATVDFFDLYRDSIRFD